MILFILLRGNSFMDIALLSGAIKNSGDYLITDRCKKLIQYVYPNANINVFIGNYSLHDHLDKINKMDAIIIAGGPSYTKKLYPRDIPLVEDLNRIKPKFFIIGSGWYGSLTSDKELWNYQFEKTSCDLLRRIEHDSKILGCRDFYSVKILQANGFESGLMTGCPAWYNIEKLTTRLEFCKDINKIIVSDPADIRAFGTQSLQLIKFLKENFPYATVEYVFHRGTTSDSFTSRFAARSINKVISELKIMGIPYHDISYGCDGFGLYDDCDLHIGYRVHAHIYNLSQRHISILIEEDSRGAGVNEVLGLWGIKGYEKKLSSNALAVMKAMNKAVSMTILNRYVVQDVESYIHYIQRSGGDIFNRAFGDMEHYFGEMIGHISTIEKMI